MLRRINKEGGDSLFAKTSRTTQGGPIGYAGLLNDEANSYSGPTSDLWSASCRWRA
jgi:hypothetical protein